MNERLRQIQAVTLLELARFARSRSTAIALGGFTALTALGQWLHWRTLPPRPDDDRLFGYAFLLAIMIGLRLGFSSDRRSGSSQLLIGNLVRPPNLFVGKFAALLVALLAFTGYTIIATGLLSAGDWSYALWYSLLFALVVWLFVPAMLLVELTMETRYPGPVVFVAFVAAITIASITKGAHPLIDLLGFNTTRLDYTSLTPLAWRSFSATGMVVILYPIWCWRTTGRIKFGQS
jgi:hypothetical protein